MHFATLVGELRAGISMLLMPISLHVMAREAQRRSTRPFAEHALIMMGGLVCCMWGLAHPLFMTGQAITAPSALLVSLLRILRLSLEGSRLDVVRSPPLQRHTTSCIATDHEVMIPRDKYDPM